MRALPRSLSSRLTQLLDIDFDLYKLIERLAKVIKFPGVIRYVT